MAPFAIAPLKLGPVTVRGGHVLSPLASISTPAFRILCEEQGASLTWSEMVSVAGLVRRQPKTLRLVRRSRLAAPFAVQLVGARPDELERAAGHAAELGVELIDLNMGCPVKKVAKTGGGVALMRTPELAARLVSAARRGAGPQVGVTVKIRLGWDDASRNAPQFARQMVEAGACAVTVHGRTRQQWFSAQCDLAGIRAVVEAVGAHVPVMGNGDVVDAASDRRMRAQTGCAAVMIGRGALGNPWVFASLTAAARGAPPPPAPGRAERVALMRRHLSLALEDDPEPVAVREIRKHLMWTSRALPGAVAFRRQLQTTTTAAEVSDAITGLEQGAHPQGG